VSAIADRMKRRLKLFCVILSLLALAALLLLACIQGDYIHIPENNFIGEICIRMQLSHTVEHRLCVCSMNHTIYFVNFEPLFYRSALEVKMFLKVFCAANFAKKFAQSAE